MAKSSFNVSLPSFYEDPLYARSQASLSGLGEGLLTGNIPEYYKGIGETGGSELEQMLSLITRDTTRSVDESLARRNISRGGIASSLTAKTVADATTKLRWSDFQRAMAGKQFLLGTGIDTVGGVRSAALNYGSQKNQFGLNRAGLELNVAKAQAEEKAQKNAMWAQILSSAIGAAGTIAGGMAGGPAGALAGGSIGSAAGKTITSSSASYGNKFDLDLSAFS